MSYETPPPVPPYQAPTPGYAAPTPSSEKYNVLAIVSLITAFFISLAAIITGHIALSQIKRTGEKGRGLAIAGLILGYLGVLASIISLILLFTVFAVGASQVENGSFNDPFATATSAPEPSSDSGSGSGSANGATQTTTEACQILNSQVSASASALSDNISQLQTDPAAAVTALQNLSQDFNTAITQINNPDVLDAAVTADTDLQSLIVDIQTFQADPTSGTSSIVTDATAVQTSFSAIGTVCG